MVLQPDLPFTVYTSAPFLPVFNSSGQVIGNTGGDYNADGFNYEVPNAPHLETTSAVNRKAISSTACSRRPPSLRPL